MTSTEHRDTTTRIDIDEVDFTAEDTFLHPVAIKRLDGAHDEDGFSLDQYELPEDEIDFRYIDENEVHRDNGTYEVNEWQKFRMSVGLQPENNPIVFPKENGDGYIPLDGHRRLKAVEENMEVADPDDRTVEVKIKSESLDDRERIRKQIELNETAKDNDPMERAVMVAKLCAPHLLRSRRRLEDEEIMTKRDVANEFSVTPPTINNWLTPLQEDRQLRHQLERFAPTDGQGLQPEHVEIIDRIVGLLDGSINADLLPDTVDAHHDIDGIFTIDDHRPEFIAILDGLDDRRLELSEVENVVVSAAQANAGYDDNWEPAERDDDGQRVYDLKKELEALARPNLDQSDDDDDDDDSNFTDEIDVSDNSDIDAGPARETSTTDPRQAFGKVMVESEFDIRDYAVQNVDMPPGEFVDAVETELNGGDQYKFTIGDETFRITDETIAKSLAARVVHEEYEMESDRAGAETVTLKNLIRREVLPEWADELAKKQSRTPRSAY